MSHGDHGDQGDASMKCPMIMTFHFGHCENILFDTWVTDTVVKFVLSAIGIFIIAVIYEGLKFWRETIYIKDIEALLAASKHNTNGDLSNGTPKYIKPIRQKMLSKGHVIQTLIHFIQVTVSYALMLVVMTFNIWLLLAIVLGATLGYFLFGWMRQRSVDFTEYCH